MRLIRPTPGEAVDRQTILLLKIKFGGGREEEVVTTGDNLEDSTDAVAYGVQRTILKDPSPVNIEPFIAENEAIQRYLEKNYLPDLTNDKGKLFDKYYEELAEINRQVWNLTDQQHILRDAPNRMQDQAVQRAAEVLFAIADLNDTRAQLVCKINELFSIRVQEKIFA